MNFSGGSSRRSPVFTLENIQLHLFTMAAVSVTEKTLWFVVS